MLYFAYGSNLDYTRMFSRCSSAEVYGKAELKGYRLVFMANNSGRKVANLIPDSTSTVIGIIYDITDNDRKVLDTYEGYPYVYGREKITVSCKGNEVNCSTYIMAEEYSISTKYGTHKAKRSYGLPSNEYYTFLFNGYIMFDLPQSALLEAYRYSSKRSEIKKVSKK